MTRSFKILLALDNLLGNLLFRGIGPDESISAYCWRRGYTRRIALIDWLMREKKPLQDRVREREERFSFGT